MNCRVRHDKKENMSHNVNEMPAILFAGGHSVDYEILEKVTRPVFMKKKNPRVAYIGAANGDRTAFFDNLNAILLQVGAADVAFVKLAREVVDTDAARETLERADIIFFSGGEVEDGINWIKRHGLTECLREQHRLGKQFLGISAGTIMIGAYWVRWDTPGDDGTAELFECLGLVPATFDTHAEDEDWIELKTALRLMGDGARGYGVPRGGIISADSDGNLTNIAGEYLTYTYKDGEFIIS